MIISEKKIRNSLADILTPKNFRIFLIALFLIILLAYRKDFLIVLFFIALGAVSMLYRLFINVGVGFELCTLSTVLCAMKYGPKYGIAVGFLCVTIGMALNTRLFRNPMDSIFHIIGFSIIGSVAAAFPLQNLFAVGMAITVVYNLIYIPFRLLFGSNIVKLLTYVATNILFNYIIFRNIAPLFVKMVS